jgi:hypothetical protein
MNRSSAKNKTAIIAWDPGILSNIQLLIRDLSDIEPCAVVRNDNSHLMPCKVHANARMFATRKREVGGSAVQIVSQIAHNHAE